MRKGKRQRKNFPNPVPQGKHLDYNETNEVKVNNGEYPPRILNAQFP